MIFKELKVERIARMKRHMSALRTYLRQAERAENEHELHLAMNGFWYYLKANST